MTDSCINTVVPVVPVVPVGIKRLSYLFGGCSEEDLRKAFDILKCKPVHSISIMSFIDTLISIQKEESGVKKLKELFIRIRNKLSLSEPITDVHTKVMSIFNAQLDIENYLSLDDFLANCFNLIDLGQNKSNCDKIVQNAKKDEKDYKKLLEKIKKGESLTTDETSFMENMKKFGKEIRGFCRKDVTEAYIKDVYLPILWIMLGARYGEYVKSPINETCTKSYDITKKPASKSSVTDLSEKNLLGSEVSMHVGDIIDHIIDIHNGNKEAKIFAQFCMDVARLYGGFTEGTSPVMEEIVTMLTDLLCYPKNQTQYPLTTIEEDKIKGKFFVQKAHIIFNPMFKMLATPIQISVAYCAGVPFYKLENSKRDIVKQQYPDYLYNVYCNIIQQAISEKSTDVVLTLLGMGVYSSDAESKSQACSEIANAIINTIGKFGQIHVHIVCLDDNKEFAQLIVNKCKAKKAEMERREN